MILNTRKEVQLGMRGNPLALGKFKNQLTNP
jgi:hypothetical protein